VPAELPGGREWLSLEELLRNEATEPASAPQAAPDAAPAPVVADELSWDMAGEPATSEPLPTLEDWQLTAADEAPGQSPAESGDFVALDELAGLEPLEPLEDWPQAEALALDEPSADAALPGAGEQAWDALGMAGLDLPEVELPTPPVAPVAAEPVAKPLSLAEVMAAPAQAINPPAGEVPPSLLPPPLDEEPVDEELREVFIEEAGEVLETIGEYLPRWQANVEDREALTEIRRAFHTLKGSGRMVRALVIGELAWSIENLLNRVLDRSITAHPAVLQVVADVVALMPALVDEFAAIAQRQRNDVDLLAATAHALAKGQPVPPPEGDKAPRAADAVVEEAAAAVQEDEGLDPQLLDIFRNEAEAHLETLVGFLADCARELPQPVTDNLQRALHTLKGSAHMAGLLPIAEVATPLERLVKEFKTNLLKVDLREAELLHEAEQLFRVGLDQLAAGQPLAPIAGSAELLERIAQIQQERLEAAAAQRRGDSGQGSDPQVLGLFLSEGMDILLDAEELLAAGASIRRSARNWVPCTTN
jgi:chemosensory pili system protein ChpA (sensor histidine kinase/response regulator)